MAAFFSRNTKTGIKALDEDTFSELLLQPGDWIGTSSDYHFLSVSSWPDETKSSFLPFAQQVRSGAQILQLF